MIIFGSVSFILTYNQTRSNFVAFELNYKFLFLLSLYSILVLNSFNCRSVDLLSLVFHNPIPDFSTHHVTICA